jgi:sarcosine oxidase subunit gamma
MIITPRDGLGMTKILARRGQATVLAQRLGIALPNSPRRVVSGDVAVLGLGRDMWLAIHEYGLSLKPLVGDSASITDQGDAYIVLRLTGPDVREALEKLIPIDLHPRAFTVGQVAETIAAHMGVLLWRIEDAADGSSVFELAVPRSVSVSFCQALAHTSHATSR